MRWFHVIGALLLSVGLSIACLMLVGYLIAPVYSHTSQHNEVVSTYAPKVISYNTPSVDSGIPILLYHAISDEDDISSEMFVPADVFALHLEYLYRSGYHTVSFEALYEHWERGAALPDKPIVISFDDGYRSFYNYALPLLESYEMCATVFVISNHLDLPRTMTPAMIRDISAAGMEIASHSHNHLYLTSCSEDEARSQLITSKELLQELLGKPVNVLAYPGGMHNDAVRQIAKEVGYLMAVGTVPGLNTAATDRFLLNRIYIERKDGFEGFVTKIEAFMGR